LLLEDEKKKLDDGRGENVHKRGKTRGGQLRA